MIWIILFCEYFFLRKMLFSLQFIFISYIENPERSLLLRRAARNYRYLATVAKLLEISLHRKCNIRKVWNTSVWCFLSGEYAIPKKIYLVHMGACKKGLCLRFILFCVTSHSGRHCTQFTPFCMESCFSDEFLRIKIACSLDIC